jgi:hypothetical protein
VGSVVGKNNLLKTKPVAIAYNKKSYHSNNVPNPLANVILKIFFCCTFIFITPQLLPMRA